MKVIVSGTFLNPELATEFADEVQKLIDADCHVLDIQTVGDIVFVNVRQTMELCTAPIGQDEPVQEPTEPVQEPEFTMEIPAAALEIPAEIPAEIPVEQPPVELVKEPEAEQTPVVTMTELGDRCIVSLNSNMAIPAIMGSGTTRLEVASIVTNGDHNDCVAFWYGGYLHKIPKAFPNEAGISNPQHQLTNNTIRVLISGSTPSSALAAFYVDVEYVTGLEKERLVFGSDVTPNM